MNIFEVYFSLVHPPNSDMEVYVIFAYFREVKKDISFKKVFALLDKTQLSGDSKEQGKVCYFRVGERQDE